MKTFDYTFLAGETKTLIGGRFFILITANAGVDVDYFVDNVNNNENATGVKSGYFYENTAGGFTKVQIKSATAQTITCAISRGKGGYNIGATSITSGIIDNVVNGNVYARKSISTDSSQNIIEKIYLRTPDNNVFISNVKNPLKKIIIYSLRFFWISSPLTVVPEALEINIYTSPTLLHSINSDGVAMPKNCINFDTKNIMASSADGFTPVGGRGIDIYTSGDKIITEPSELLYNSPVVLSDGSMIIISTPSTALGNFYCNIVAEYDVI